MENKHRKPLILQESGAVFDQMEFITADPQGSYTGIAEDPWEKPVQDADDL